MFITLIRNLLITFIVVLDNLLPVLNLTFFVKPNKKHLFIFSNIVFILIYVLHLLDYRHYLFLIPIIIFIYVFIIYRTISVSIIISSFIWIITSIADALTGAVFIYFLKYTYLDISNDSTADFLSDVLILLFSYVLSKIFRIFLLKLFNKLDFDFNNFKDSHAPLFFAFTILIFAIYQTLINNFVSSWNDFMTLSYAFNLLVFFIFIITISYYFLNILITNHKVKEYDQLKNYTDIIENITTDLRSFKHDYLNILATLAGYLENNNINELKEYYYNELLPESNEIMNKDMSISLLYNIKLSPLKALLSAKITAAHSKKINVSIEILDDIDFINMNVIDICRIIGIFMDNAIEASILCSNKTIHIAIVKVDYGVVFNISNTCLESTPPVYKIYQNKLSTKGAGRGLGLNNVKNILNHRYKNTIFNTTIKNCIFTQELIIRNK